MVKQIGAYITHIRICLNIGEVSVREFIMPPIPNQHQNRKQMEQNNKNASNSVVTAISDGSPTEQESKDAFLMGFDSED